MEGWHCHELSWEGTWEAGVAGPEGTVSSAFGHVTGRVLLGSLGSKAEGAARGLAGVVEVGVAGRQMAYDPVTLEERAEGAGGAQGPGALQPRGEGGEEAGPRGVAWWAGEESLQGCPEEAPLSSSSSYCMDSASAHRPQGWEALRTLLK